MSGLRLRKPGEAPAEDLLAERLTIDAGPAPVVAAGTYNLTNHGGSTIATPRLVLLTVNGWYGDTKRLQDFAHDLMEGGYLDGLKNYGSGRGTFYGLVALTDPAWVVGGVVTSAIVAATVQNAIAAGSVPKPDGSTFYLVLSPKDVAVVDDQGKRCQFCGWHTAVDNTLPFGVICDTTQSCCGGGVLDPFNAACMVIAHEVAESCTDKIPGGGWFDDASGMENADICAWQQVAYGPFTVQPYWTNEHGGYVGPYEDHHTVVTPPPSQGGGGNHQPQQDNIGLPLVVPAGFSQTLPFFAWVLQTSASGVATILSQAAGMDSATVGALLKAFSGTTSPETQADAITFWYWALQQPAFVAFLDAQSVAAGWMAWLRSKGYVK